MTNFDSDNWVEITLTEMSLGQGELRGDPEEFCFDGVEFYMPRYAK